MTTRTAAPIVLLATCAGVACTWGTYDGHSVDGGGGGGDGSGGDGAAPTVTVSPSGGEVVSDDGLFKVTFPSGSLSAQAQVSITHNADQGGLPALCTNGKSLSCWKYAYSVNILGGAYLSATARVSFQLGPSGFSQNTTFIVRVPSQQALPGVWPASSNAVSAFQAPDNNSSLLGPYVLVNAFGQVSATTVCGNGVCDQCAQGCCPGASSAPPTSAQIHESCMCAGPSPATEDCMIKCVSTPGSETCP